MRLRVELLPVAYEDIQEALDWYGKINEVLKNDLLQEINLQIDLISENPLLFQKRYKNVRLRLTERFPYAVYYQFNEIEKSIIVLAVLHTKQNPEISIARNR